MSTADVFSVAVAQMNSIDRIEYNLTQMQDLISQAHTQKVQLVCFPENCLYLRLVEGEKIKPILADHPALIKLAEMAKQLQISLHLGSLPLGVGNQLFNHSVLIDSLGKIRPTYQKIHLFDIALEGQKPIRESDVFARGEEPQILQLDNFRFGETICYDIRFSELFHRYAQAEVDAMLIPAAFLKTTGEAHWDVLLRARAIESQAYVLASAQSGLHKSESVGQRETFGKSQIIDPWGRVLADAGQGVKLIFAELDKKVIQKVRTQIPMKNHRRL